MGFLGKLFGRGGAPATPLDADARLGRVLDAVLDCCEYALFAGEGAAGMAERVARQRPDRECLACEPGSDSFYSATARTAKVKNLYLFNQRPREFLLGVRDGKPYLLERDTLVVLHVPGGGAERRVFDEVAFVAEFFAAPFLLVLGCRVPGEPGFLYDTHQGRECSPANLGPHLGGAGAGLLLPAYAPPGGRLRAKGWCLLPLGRNAHHLLPEETSHLLRKADPEPAAALP
jgi:hypothetical protein